MSGAYSVSPPLIRVSPGRAASWARTCLVDWASIVDAITRPWLSNRNSLPPVESLSWRATSSLMSYPATSTSSRAVPPPD